MSPPIWIVDPKSVGKKSLKSYQVRNYSTGMTKKTDNEHTISDLLTEMQDILCENAKLQSENCLLKKEVEGLRSRNEALIYDIDTSKEKFEDDLLQLQNNIKLNEAQLIDNSKKCLQQQKKQIEEIVLLRAENEQLRLNLAKHVKECEKVKNIENELKALQLTHNNIIKQNEENGQKSTRYKNKLKYAITIINDLNNMLVRYSQKPKLNTCETQTEDEFHVQELSSNQTCNTSLPITNLETEHFLLDEIFFKSKSFCDNELLLINETDSSHTGDLNKTKTT